MVQSRRWLHLPNIRTGYIRRRPSWCTRRDKQIIQWDAEDWDSRFTPKGKIRIIATWQRASGFSGTGDAGIPVEQADASLVSVQWGPFDWTHDGSLWHSNDHTGYLMHFPMVEPLLA